MGLFGFVNALRNPQTADFQAIAARYRRLRPTHLRLNSMLTSRLSRSEIEEGAAKLGMMSGGAIVLDNEDEICLVMDYCIYNVFRNGRNAIDQHLCNCPPDPDSDEMTCLHAMQHATYALVAVLRAEPGVGCHVRNLFTEEVRLLADVGFSKTAKPGTVLATRLLDYGDYLTTSGAALPLGILKDDALDELQRELRRGMDDGRSDPAPLIRECLRNGASSHIRYDDTDARRRLDPSAAPRPTMTRAERPPMTRAERKRVAAERRAATAPTNRRCRCGSGKMYKNCCGKR